MWYRNAPGAGVADDKASLVPTIPRFDKKYIWRGGTNTQKNIKTYIVRSQNKLQMSTENIAEWWLKQTDGSGGYGMLIRFSRMSTRKRNKEFVKKSKTILRNICAQPMDQSFPKCHTLDKGIRGRHVD